MSDPIEYGHQVGTIPQRQDVSKHTFRNGDNDSSSINSFHLKGFKSPLKSLSFELKLTNIGNEDSSQDIFAGTLLSGLLCHINAIKTYKHFQE